MHEHTLTVPAEYAEQFHCAVLREIKSDSEGVEDALKEGPESVREWTQRLNQSVALANQVPAELNNKPVPVRSDAETLAHACEALARQVVGPRIQGALMIGPMDEHAVPEDLQLLGAARWAVEAAYSMHTSYAEERGWKAAA